MRIFPQELFIRRLKGTLPKGREYSRARDWVLSFSETETIEKLKQLSGEDFGEDADAWDAWWKAERKRLDIDPDF